MRDETSPSSRRRAAALHATALALVVVAWPAAPARAQPRQAYEGAAKIGNLDRITVVYPAGEGQAARVLADNGALKASYLSNRYGVVATAVADDAVSAEQRQGHLLVLGWDNALTRDEWFRQAVRRDGDRVFFLGVPATATDDLLWMHVNPYATDKYLVFWSRLDPELDRLLPFPFIGSDWAWYRDYFVLHQGNFVDAPVWPPAREPLAENDSPWQPLPLAATRGHYAVHHREGGFDDASRDAIFMAREEALARAAALLGVALPDGFRINLYVYPDAEVKHLQTGVADAVHSLPSRRELHLTMAHARSAAPQEEIHLLAGEVWGLCHAAGMYQGLAIWLQADRRDQGAYAALLVEQDRVPRVAELFADETLRNLVRAGYGFPAAALLVEWIDARGGRAAVATAYGLLRGEALEGLARLFALPDGSAVEAAFAAWMRERAAGAQEDLAYRRAIDKARERARVGDYPGQIGALEQALAVRHEDTLAYQLALVEIEAGETAKGRARLEGLVARTPPPSPAWVAAFSRVKLAELLAADGQAEAARRLYREVLAGPDEHDAHRHAREGLDALD